jgi:Glycosyl hydrolase family 76
MRRSADGDLPVVIDAVARAWSALERASFRPSWDGFAVVEDSDHHARASLWTLVHVLWAACDAVELGLDVPIEEVAALIERYRRDDGYAATLLGRRYFDDNAWLGLVSLRLAHVTGDRSHAERAAELSDFVRTGEDPAGGVRWVEGGTTRNTCSTAPAAWLAMVAEPGAARAFAARVMDWLVGVLRRDDGLFADRIDGGTVEPTVWSYNQAAAVTVLRLLDRHDEADVTATAAAGTFEPDRTWTEPPPFLAIWFRAMLEDPLVGEAVRASLDRHVERMLAEALDGAGLFTQSGIGSYDGRRTIDQAAAAQLLALHEAARSSRPTGPVGTVVE